MYGGLFWAVVKTIDFLIKLVRLLFRQLLKKLGQLFIPTSGHTTPELIKCWLFRSIPAELVPSISRNFLLTWRKSSEKRRTIRLENFNSVVVAAGSMTSIKSPNVYKSCPKVISLEKWKIYKNFLKCGWFGQTNCCHKLWKVAQSVINCPIWSHWSWGSSCQGVERQEVEVTAVPQKLHFVGGSSHLSNKCLTGT